MRKRIKRRIRRIQHSEATQHNGRKQTADIRKINKYWEKESVIYRLRIMSFAALPRITKILSKGIKGLKSKWCYYYSSCKSIVERKDCWVRKVSKDTPFLPKINSIQTNPIIRSKTSMIPNFLQIAKKYKPSSHLIHMTDNNCSTIKRLRLKIKESKIW